MKVNVPDQCEMQMKVKMRYENRRGRGAVGITRCLASDIVTESPECSTQDGVHATHSTREQWREEAETNRALRRAMM